ncbi:MAG: hypothetical protein RSC00_07055, partial [Ruthenibacterium sp.]
MKTLHAILQLVEDIIQCYKKRPQIKAKATNGCHPKQIVEIDSFEVGNNNFSAKLNALCSEAFD